MKVHFDTNEFENLFGEREKEVVEAASTPRAAQPEKKQKIQLLDPKRSNNCSIMLRGVKMSPADIKKAVTNFDDNAIKEDQLRAIKDFVPAPEEIQVLKDYTGDKNDLGDAEKFMLEIMTVPGFAVKINAMLFRIQFADKSNIAKTVRFRDIRFYLTHVSRPDLREPCWNTRKSIFCPRPWSP